VLNHELHILPLGRSLHILDDAQCKASKCRNRGSATLKFEMFKVSP